MMKLLALQRLVLRKHSELLQSLDSERIFLYAIWFARWVALTWVVEYFVINAESVRDRQLMLWLLFSAYAYIIAIGIAGAYRSLWFDSRWAKCGQVAIELVLYTLLVWVDPVPASYVFILYAYPLIIAARYLGLPGAGITLLLAIGAVSAIHFSRLGPDRIYLVTVLTPRLLFLSGASLLGTFRSRGGIVLQLKAARDRLTWSLRGFTDGIFVVDAAQRLILVNEVLRDKHGPFVPGDTRCADYFHCTNRACEWCTTAARAGTSDPLERRTGDFTDQDSHRYPIEVDFQPIVPMPDGGGLSLAVVRDLGRTREQTRRVEEYERNIRLGVLAGFEHRRVLTKAAQETSHPFERRTLLENTVRRAATELRAEAAQLFLLEDDRLVLRAWWPSSRDWLTDEAYERGVGLTGRVLLTPDGTRYGQPVRKTEADRDPLIVNRYLAAYGAHLTSRRVRDLLAVPLNGSSRSIGVLRVLNRMDQNGLADAPFSEVDEDLLLRFGELAASALENETNRLLQESTQSERELRTLYDLLARLTQVSDREALLAAIVNEASRTIDGATRAVLYLADSRTKTLTAMAPGEVSGGQSEETSGQTIVRRAYEQQETVIDQKVGQLAVPLRVGSEIIGVLLVLGRTGEIDEMDKRVSEGLARTASIAIERAELHAREQERRELAEALRDVADLDEALNTVLERLRRVVHYDSASIHLVSGSQLKIFAAVGFRDSQRLQGVTFPIAESKYPNAVVMRTRAPLRLADAPEQYPHFRTEVERLQSENIHAWLGIPLIHRANLVGMMALDKRTVGYFTSADEAAGMDFANRVAGALANVSLLEQTRQRTDELARLNEAVRVINHSLDRRSVLRSIAHWASTVAGEGQACVGWVGPRGVLTESYEADESVSKLHVRARTGGQGVTDWVIQHAEPRIFDDVTKDANGVHNPYVLEEHFQSYGAFPIRVRGAVCAVLFLHSRRIAAIGPLEQLMRTFCAMASVALENAMNHAELQMQSRMLGALVETATGLIAHRPEQDIYEDCVHQGAAIFGVEECAVFTINANAQVTELRASHILPKHVWQSDRPLYGKGLTAYVAREKKRLNLGGPEIANHEAHRGEDPANLKWLPSGRSHSLLLEFIKNAQHHYIGVLKLENNLDPDGIDKPFTPFVLNLAHIYGSYIGMAVERAHLFREIAAEERQAARANLGTDLHALANDLHSSLVQGSEIVRLDLEHGQQDDANKKLIEMNEAGQYLVRRLRDLRQDVLDPVLQAHGLLEALRRHAHMKKLHADFEAAPWPSLPYATAHGLFNIAREALTNVGKYAARGLEPPVAILRFDLTADEYCLTITDHGMGFPVTKHIGDPNARGLAEMQWQARALHAQLDFTSNDSGTQVLIRGTIQMEPQHG